MLGLAGRDFRWANHGFIAFCSKAACASIWLTRFCRGAMTNDYLGVYGKATVVDIETPDTEHEIVRTIAEEYSPNLLLYGQK